ncbi:hypothetical protein [Burkholderia multivorans]|nr:hypothetical protein [Burkholderia multivorans]MBR7922697.1 hypothetical protein [Burkholderia multivorans]
MESDQPELMMRSLFYCDERVFVVNEGGYGATLTIFRQRCRRAVRVWMGYPPVLAVEVIVALAPRFSLTVRAEERCTWRRLRVLMRLGKE